MINPLVPFFSSLSPTLITLFGCLLGVSAAAFIPLGYPWVALFLLLLSGVCDTIDGTIARLTGRTSELGAVCDIVCDRVVEAAIVIALFLVEPGRGLIMLLVLSSFFLCVTSFLVVGIFHENGSTKSFHYSPGLIERAEAFLFFVLMILFPRWFAMLGITLFLLVLVTTMIRLIEFANISSRP